MRPRFLPQRSIRAKLMLLATASGCVAVLLACLGFMSNDVRLMHEAKLRQIAAQAELLGFNSSAALAVRDQGAAEQLLAALKFHSSIDSALLFDRNGERLAEFHNGEEVADLAGSLFAGEQLRSRRPFGIRASSPGRWAARGNDLYSL